VRDLAARREADGSVTLEWKAPGDDWLCGRAATYQVILAAAPIDSPDDGDVVLEGAAGQVDAAESALLAPTQVQGRGHAAVLYRDEARNWGFMKSIKLPSAAGGGGADGGGGAGGGGGGGGTGGGGYGEECSNEITGTGADDRLKGIRGDDRIRGRGGDDRIRGRGGDDCVSGQAGKDRIDGGSGNDLIKGGRGQDRLRGGSGDDVIKAARGARDKINCGAGEDIAFVNNRRDRARNCEKIRAG